jgi:hypothetical protein
MLQLFGKTLGVGPCGGQVQAGVAQDSVDSEGLVVAFSVFSLNYPRARERDGLCGFPV